MKHLQLIESIIKPIVFTVICRRLLKPGSLSLRLMALSPAGVFEIRSSWRSLSDLKTTWKYITHHFCHIMVTCCHKQLRTTHCSFIFTFQWHLDFQKIYGNIYWFFTKRKGRTPRKLSICWKTRSRAVGQGLTSDNFVTSQHSQTTLM